MLNVYGVRSVVHSYMAKYQVISATDVPWSEFAQYICLTHIHLFVSAALLALW